MSEQQQPAAPQEPQDRKETGFKAFWNRPLKSGKDNKPRTVGKEIMSWVMTIASAVVIALLIRAFVFELYNVEGTSMTNTLQNNEKMFCTKIDYLLGSPQRNDVVICHYPGRDNTAFVKRLVALPGDTVEIRHRQLYVNGELIPDPPLMNSEPRSDYPLRTLGEDEYFVIGDNRGNSNDSRYVGPLSRSQIVAHVRQVIFPFSAWRSIE